MIDTECPYCEAETVLDISITDLDADPMGRGSPRSLDQSPPEHRRLAMTFTPAEDAFH